MVVGLKITCKTSTRVFPDGFIIIILIKPTPELMRHASQMGDALQGEVRGQNSLLV